MKDDATLSGDPDLMIARVRERVEQTQQRARVAQQMRLEVEAVRGKVTSPRRELAVTVDASGRLVDVELSDAAMDLRPREVSGLIVETAQAAQRDAGDQAVAVASKAFGDQSPVVARLRDELDSRAAQAED